MAPVAGSSGICPETKRSEPALIAWEYGPMALGAASDETACRMLGDGLAGPAGLDHFVGPQTPRADTQALDAAIHERAHALKIRFEPARGDIVRVADITAEDRPFSAEFAAFRHDYL